MADIATGRADKSAATTAFATGRRNQARRREMPLQTARQVIPMYEARHPNATAALPRPNSFGRPSAAGSQTPNNHRREPNRPAAIAAAPSAARPEGRTP